MTRAAFFAFMVFAASPALAETPASLFFTPDESGAIADLEAKEAQPDDQSLLRLDALFYYGPGDWVFWLANQRWVPGSQRPNLRVLGVAADAVRLQWTDHNAAPRDITLKPHQAIQAATGTIVER